MRQVVSEKADEVADLGREVLDAERARPMDERPRGSRVGAGGAPDPEVDAPGYSVSSIRKFSATFSAL